jgi:penicillin-binding protein 1A
MALPIWGKFFQKIYADSKLKVSKNEFKKPKNFPESLEVDCSKYDAEPVEGIIEDSEFNEN